MDATGPVSEGFDSQRESGRQRILHERTREGEKEKENRLMSVLSQSSPAALQPARPCPGPCLCLTGWLAEAGWQRLAGWRLAVLGRACGNTCETAIIMAFCLRGGGTGRCVPQSRNAVPCDLQHNLLPTTVNQPLLLSTPSSSRLCSRVSSQEIDAQDVTLPPYIPFSTPPSSDAVN